MSRIYQVPSHARTWLTLGVVATSLPQLLRGPWWQSGVLVGVLIWRALIDRQRLAMPNRWLRLALLVATVAASWYSFGRLYGPDAGTALITSLFALKYLELVGKRDAYVLIVLGYFVCATALLFYRGPGAAFYVLACLVLLTAGLAGINYSDTHARQRQHLAVAASLMAQALPLAVILFVLVPRIAPLWNMHLDAGQARTGISDSMSPGQVSALTESDALAFRVQFQGPVPPHRDLYWRGLTYSYFDGTTWSQATPRRWSALDTLYTGHGPQPDWYRTLLKARGEGGPEYRYRVIMEPSHRRWLYALAVPFTDPGTDSEGIGLARDLRLVADRPVDNALSYRVHSVPSARAAATLGAAERHLMLQLPPGVDPRARRLARQWRERYPRDADLVHAALNYFRRQPFYYTLKPPRVGGDSVDGFLFDTRRGFCEHFASSFTFLMRAAGIPARIVAGYQGGEMNAGEYLQVRQYDAHAWSEVWLSGRWVAVDPTAAVAPDRIEKGLRATLEEQGDSAASAFAGLHRLPVLFRLQQWVDYLDFNWRKWVLGYRRDQQLRLLQRFLGEVTPTRVAFALLGSVAVFVGVLAVLVLLRRRPGAAGPLQKEFAHLHGALVRRGLPPAPGASAAQLEQRIVRRWPAAGDAAAHWRRLYEFLAYRRDDQPGPTDLARLRRRRRALMRRLSR